jgi:hypothetical protein
MKDLLESTIKIAPTHYCQMQAQMRATSSRFAIYACYEHFTRRLVAALVPYNREYADMMMKDVKDFCQKYLKPPASSNMPDTKDAKGWPRTNTKPDSMKNKERATARAKYARCADDYHSKPGNEIRVVMEWSKDEKGEETCKLGRLLHSVT